MNTLQLFDIGLVAVPASIGLAWFGSLLARAKPALAHAEAEETAQKPLLQECQSDSVSAPLPLPPATPLPLPKLRTAPAFSPLVSACIGFLLLAPWLAMLTANSYLIAQAVETVFSGGGETLFTLGLLDWQRPISDYDLIGALVCLGQFIAGACLSYSLSNRNRFVVFIAIGALVPLVFFEVSGQYARVAMSSQEMLADAPVSPNLAVLGACLAAGVAMSEILTGIYVLEHFLAPLLAIIARLVFFPFRFIDAWLHLRQPSVSEQLPVPARNPSLNPVGKGKPRRVLLNLAGAIDDALFDPLRKLDALVFNALCRLTTQK